MKIKVSCCCDSWDFDTDGFPVLGVKEVSVQVCQKTLQVTLIDGETREYKSQDLE